MKKVRTQSYIIPSTTDKSPFGFTSLLSPETNRLVSSMTQFFNMRWGEVVGTGHNNKLILYGWFSGLKTNVIDCSIRCSNGHSTCKLNKNV